MAQGQNQIPMFVPPRRTELAGKRLGHVHTKKEQTSDRYKAWFYDPRPDLASTKTRKTQWEQIHSKDRFIQALFFYIGPPGHLIYNLRFPLSIIMFTLFLNFVYYILAEFVFPTLPRIDQRQSLVAMFRLGSFTVSLLLAMRLNRTYDRWWQGRNGFGGVASNTTQAAQLIAVWVDDEAFVQRFVNTMIVYHYTIMIQLLALKSLPPEAVELLSPEEHAVYTSTKKMRQLSALHLHELLRQANLDMERYTVVEQLLMQAIKDGGTCASIKFQAMPYSISIVCTGFVFIWLLFLTIGVFGYNNSPDNDTGHIIFTVFTALLSGVGFFFFALLMLSCDEIANQLEDPFHQMPLVEIVKVSAGHMQRTVKELRALREAREKAEARVLGHERGGLM